MLILSRKPGDAIVIDGGIRIVVLSSGKSVRLGIEAPAQIGVVREEVLVRKEGPRTLISGNGKPKEKKGDSGARNRWGIRK